MEQLVDRYHASLYRFALGLTGSVHQAADLTQQTFLLWATKGHQLRDGTKVRSWLFTTLHREYIRGWRQEKRHPRTDIDSVEHELPAVEPDAVGDLDGRTVLEALHQLEEPFRAPLLLHYIEELSYREIAEALDVPIGTVMSRLSRGKAILRARLREAVEERGADGVIRPSLDWFAKRRGGPAA